MAIPLVGIVTIVIIIIFVFLRETISQHEYTKIFMK